MDFLFSDINYDEETALFIELDDEDDSEEE